MTNTLDTHALVKSLINAGLEEKAAEEIVKVVIDTKIQDMSLIATKLDLEKIQGDIANVKTNLLKWYIGTTLTVLTAIATVLSIYYAL